MSESLIINIIIITIGFLSCCFILILIIRYILEYAIDKSIKNYEILKQQSKKIFTSKNIKSEKFDEELYRYKSEIPKANSQLKAEKKQVKLQEKYQIIEELKNNEEEKIVGIAKPLGFWTRRIFGQRIATILAQAESYKKEESTKFWQNFVRASRAQSRFQENNRNMR